MPFRPSSILLGRGAQWIARGDGIDADLDIDFTSNAAYVNGLYRMAHELLTTARGTLAWVDDAAGNWTQVGVNQARVSNKGILVEETRINSLRNNSMQGAVPGNTPITPQTISSITFAGTTATITMAANHGLNSGDLLTVIGATPAAYNGNFAFAKTSNTVGTYVMASNPGSNAAPVGAYTAISQGTLPTNWVPNLFGCAWIVLGTGIESGMEYCDFRVVGTLSASVSRLFSDASTQIAALYGQTWITSVFVTLIGGSTTNVGGVYSTLVERNSGGSTVTIKTGTGQAIVGALGLNRKILAYTLPSSTCAFISATVDVFGSIGAAIDISIRVGWPQLEQVTINTAIASATVSGGTAYTNGDLVTVSGGTFTTQAKGTLTVAAGVPSAITFTGGSNTGGSYSVLPTSPAAVTGGTGSGLTLTLTPADNSALATATSPIRTTAAAAQRSFDYVQIPGLTFGTAQTLFAQGYSFDPPGHFSNVVCSVDDGTAVNRISPYRSTVGPGNEVTSIINNSVQSNLTSGIQWLANTRGKVAVAVANTDAANSFNGGAVGTIAGAWPAPVTQISVGANGNSNLTAWNGYVERISCWLNTRLSNTALQQLST